MARIRSRPKQEVYTATPDPHHGRQELACLPLLGSCHLGSRQAGGGLLGGGGVEVVGNPGDSLSPPDISPVRPLIRQAGRAGPTSPVGCSVWAGACRATQAPAAQYWPIPAPRPRRPTLRSRRTDRAPPHPPSREPSSALSTVVENTSFN